MKKLIYLMAITISTISCQKEELLSIETPPETSSDSYYPLAIGNYWIYQHYKIDSLGNEEILNRMDTVKIDRDTIIEDRQYYIAQIRRKYTNNSSDWEDYGTLRYQAGELLNIEENVIFSSHNFTDTLGNYTLENNGTFIYSLSTKMEHTPSSVVVPAGEFQVLNKKGTLIVNPNNTGVPNIRYLNNLYAMDVGVVLDTYYYISGLGRFERRLIEYHLN